MGSHSLFKQAKAQWALTVLGVMCLHAMALVWVAQSPVLKMVEAAPNEQHTFVLASLITPVASPTRHIPVQAKPPNIQKTPTKTATQHVVDTPKPIKAAAPIESVQTPSLALSEHATQPHTSSSDSSAATPGKHEQHAPAVVQPSSSAAYLNNPKPPYPALSRRLNEQGKVVVRVLINTDGKAEHTELLKTSGYSRLDDSALKTVTQWRFVPGTRNGVPHAMWFNVPIHFVLE